MKLRMKILLITGMIFLILFSSLLITLQVFVLQSYNDLESNKTSTNVERATEAFSDEINKLMLITSDWAAWDDTYQFIEDRNEQYINATLNDATLQNLELSFILYYNTTGGLVFGKAYDFQNNITPVPLSLFRQFDEHPWLLQYNTTESSLSGYLLLPEELVLIAFHPILTSEWEGPIHGTLIMGRRLDADRIEQISNKLHLSITVHQLNAPFPSTLDTIYPSLTADTPIIVKPLNDTVISGYALLNDFYGNPALIIEINLVRDIHQQSILVMWYLILSYLIIGLVIDVLIVIFLERFIVVRLTTLNNNMREISVDKDLSKRIEVKGKDELSTLTRTMNTMLTSLQNYQEQLWVSEKKSKAILNAIPDIMFEISNTGIFLSYKAEKEEDLMVRPEEFLGKKISDVFPEEFARKAMTYIDLTLKTRELQVFEYQLPKLSGKLCDYEVRFIVSGPEKVLVIVRDVTDRKQAERIMKKDIEELEKFQKVTVDRELKMVELKKKIKELEEELNKK